MSEARNGGRLTTHALDLVAGSPAHGLRVDLFRLEAARRDKLGSFRTNADGRCGALLAGGDLRIGEYELVFHVGDYFKQSAERSGPLFLDRVPIRFGVNDSSRNWHVPLLISPFGYTTHRGS